MATSIFPDSGSAGGIVIRDAAGNCLPNANVANAYCPPATFVVTCDMTALPSDCTARIEPRQINAIVSELVSFAECMDPDGPWNCGSTNNLCAAFNSWVATLTKNTFIFVGDTPPVGAPQDVLWWESDTGFLFIHFNDGSSLQWVQIGGNVGATSVVMDQVSIIGSGTVADPHKVDLIDCGVW